MSLPLKEAYHLFWTKISEIWCHSSQIRYLPTLCDRFQVSSIKFSPATGLYIFVNGECFPHWPTLDDNVTTQSQKYYQRLLTSTTSAKASSHSVSLSATSVLDLPSVPFYNLFLQDMRCRITLPPTELSESLPNRTIEVTDRLGWNGTGAIRFFSSIGSSSLEVPIEMSLQSLDTITTIHLIYLCQESSFRFSVRLSCEIDYSSPLETTPPVTVEAVYSMEREEGLTRVFYWLNEEKIIVSDAKTLLLSQAQTAPSYCWADASSASPLSIDTGSDEELTWHRISFPVLSADLIDSLKSTFLSAGDISTVKIVNCRMALDEITDLSASLTDKTAEESLGLVLGSFEILSSLLPHIEEDHLASETIELINPQVERPSGCRDDGR
jgi:hypothetical protein